jgi:hypothetical protein
MGRGALPRALPDCLSPNVERLLLKAYSTLIATGQINQQAAHLRLIEQAHGLHQDAPCPVCFVKQRWDNQYLARMADA